MGMGLRQVLHYSSILKEQAFKSLWVLNGENVQQVPSLAFEIAYEEQEFKENMIDFLDKKPVRLGEE